MTFENVRLITITNQRFEKSLSVFQSLEAFAIIISRKIWTEGALSLLRIFLELETPIKFWIFNKQKHSIHIIFSPI